ncbi:MAG TPA: ATP-binding protein [Streptosporangiaceae bacterium]
MAEAPVLGPAGRTRARWWPLRLVSTVILLVMGGVVVASALITLSVIRDQERLLLRERTGEAAAVLGGAFAGVQSSLLLLGAIAATDRGHPQLFASAAHPEVTAPGQGLLVTAQRGTQMTVTAAAGTAPAVGSAIPPDQVRLAHRALVTRGMVSGLVRQGSRRWIAFGLGNAAGPATVVWEESALASTVTTKPSASSPWGNLDIALYLSARPDPSTLILATTRNLPLAGAQYPFRVGADTWLLVTSSPGPLVGSLAENMPWVILVIGVIAVALTVTVVETMGRRRDYADRLVEERTASLQNAMTELEAAQARLVQQEKLAAVGQLASSVGHELRNPLAVIMNVLYLLEAGTGADADEATRRHLATAKRETSTATLIVSDLLDYARGREPILGPVQVCDLVTEALSVVPPPAGVQVVDHCDPGITIHADRDQIRQAVLNLITNGYESMPDGGVLTVSASSESGSAHITVTDTGMGMDTGTRENIFTPFYTSKARGIGLGLAVTQRVVEAHDGTIAVESTPSVGSSFTITVPVMATMVSVAP